MISLDQNGTVAKVLIVVICVVLVPAVFVSWLAVFSAHDESYFIQLDEQLQALADEVRKTFEDKIEIDQVNNCYNTEQGPFDDGKLWCFVSQAYYVEIENKAEALPVSIELVTHLENMFLQAGFSGTLGRPYMPPTSEVILMGDGRKMRKGGMFGMVCNFALWYPSSGYPGNYLPKRPVSDKEVQLSLSCGDRSAKKVFDYIP
jgi:hypothetical protein